MCFFCLARQVYLFEGFTHHLQANGLRHRHLATQKSAKPPISAMLKGNSLSYEQVRVFTWWNKPLDSSLPKKSAFLANPENSNLKHTKCHIPHKFYPKTPKSRSLFPRKKKKKSCILQPKQGLIDFFFRNSKARRKVDYWQHHLLWPWQWGWMLNFQH